MTLPLRRLRAMLVGGAEVPMQLSSWQLAVLTLGWIAGTVGVLAVVDSVRYLPTHDGPQVLYLGWLQNHFLAGPTPYAAVYDVGKPATALGFHVLFSALEPWLGWRVAYRTVLGLIAVVWSSGAWYLLGALDRRRAVLGLVVFGCVLQWSLYMGFYSYMLSLGLGWMLAGIALRRAAWSRWDRVVIGVMLTVQAVLHVFGAQASVLLLGMIVVHRTGARGLLRELGRLLLLAIPTIAITAYASGWLGGGERLAAYGTPSFIWESSLHRAAAFGRLFVGGPLWRAWLPVLLAAVGAAAGIVAWRRRTASAEERALLTTAAVCAASAVFLPFHIQGRWDFLSPRFLPVAVLLPIALIPVERLRRSGWFALAGGLALFSSTSLVWSTGFHRRIVATCADGLSGLSQPIRRSGFRLPIMLKSRGASDGFWKEEGFPYVAPLVNAGPLYAIEQGGIVPYVYATLPPMHPFVVSDAGLRLFPPVPDRRTYWTRAQQGDAAVPGPARDQLLDTLAAFGASFEDVILYGLPSDADFFVKRGYESDWRQGGLMIGRFRGCPARIELRLGGRLPASVRLKYAWSAADAPRRVIDVPPVAFDNTGDATVVLKGAPCGALSYEVDAPEVVCRGTARLSAREEGGPVLSCRPQ